MITFGAIPRFNLLLGKWWYTKNKNNIITYQKATQN